MQHVSKPTITIVLPILLKSSVDISGFFFLVWIGRGACSVHRPAVCYSLFAVWWFGDEFEMSHWLPVRAEQLWVASGPPQAWADGSYSSLAPHRVHEFMNLCDTYTHTHTTNTHTYCISKHTSLNTNKNKYTKLHLRLFMHINCAGS